MCLLTGLAACLSSVNSRLDQPWYADDAGASTKFDGRIECMMVERLYKIGSLLYGSDPEPTKSIPIVHKHNLGAAWLPLS
jgi:hypothetical protein